MTLGGVKIITGAIKLMVLSFDVVFVFAVGVMMGTKQVVLKDSAVKICNRYFFYKCI